MTKDQLLSLWNADNWEVMSCGVYFTAHRADADKELHINCNDYTEAEILAMPFWERLAQELDELGVNDLILDPGFGFGKTLEK